MIDTINIVIITALVMYLMSSAVTLVIFFIENRSLRGELMRAVHTLAVYQAAKEGDMDTARLMAAVTREPVSSAGAKQPQGAVMEEEVETGILITQEQ